MDICDWCEMFGDDDCDKCPLGNPCLGCEHYENNDCEGQCYSLID